MRVVAGRPSDHKHMESIEKSYLISYLVPSTDCLSNSSWDLLLQTWIYCWVSVNEVDVDKAVEWENKMYGSIYIFNFTLLRGILNKQPGQEETNQTSEYL